MEKKKSSQGEMVQLEVHILSLISMQHSHRLQWEFRTGSMSGYGPLHLDVKVF